MKKYLVSLLALVLGMGMLHANPVDLNKAKLVGQQFVQANFESRSGDLSLVYTATTEKGAASFYAFNVGDAGFVVVSADDYYRPIIAYSKTCVFDLDNPGRAFFIRNIERGRSNRNVGNPTPDVAAEWERVMNTGYLLSRNGGRAVAPLLQTRWNQNYPYNYYAPELSGGPGGHFYAGCVATAMSQVMKYWNYPAQGQGSHSYYHGGTHTTYSANFGQTTYDWDNMPNSISSSSPIEQIQAVALLMYHCGVAVDMNWEADGSGSNSQIVPGAIANYFLYATQAEYKTRASLGATAWAQKIRESIDMGWPVYYSGYEQTETGLSGHAFALDGYDDNDGYHFNYGWSGSGDDYYTFEEQEFSLQDGAIFNFVPQAVYNNAPQAPTNLTVTPGADNALSATLTWTNPTKTLNNTNLSNIDQIVIMRGSDIVATIDNPTPGASMTYVDNEVPRFDMFKYSVYAVVNGSHGKVVYSEAIPFGPSCSWTIMMGSSDFQGWRGGSLSIYNAAGTLVKTCTTTSSSPSNIAVQMPLGRVSFSWKAPSTDIATVTIVVKNSENNSVYNFSGPSTDLEEGEIFTTNNGCGNELGTAVPTNLFAIRDEENVSEIHVSWDGVTAEGYGYNVYRDGLLFRTIPSATSFTDTNLPDGGHCYYATFLSYGGETEGQSNESCATTGVGCDPARNLNYETTGALNKTKLLWSLPETTEGLSGYIVYRKADGENNYKRVKMISNPNTTNYTDNSLNEANTYYYKVYAYYHDTDCTSAPAAWIYNSNQFYIQVYWSPTGVEEHTADGVSLYPNPTKDSFTLDGEGLQHVSVFNTIGQLVYSAPCEGNSAVIDLSQVESGFYMVKVVTVNGEVTKKVSVIR